MKRKTKIPKMMPVEMRVMLEDEPSIAYVHCFNRSHVLRILAEEKWKRIEKTKA